MFVVNLTQDTNGNFVSTFVLTAYADLLDFTQGVFHAQMRLTVDSPIVFYEWSTANGRISYDQTLAQGAINFTVNPAPGDTVTIGSTAITFVASGAVGNQVNIAGTLPATVLSLFTFLSASLDSQLFQCTYAIVSSNNLALTYKTAGTLGNSFPIAASGAGTTLSGATLLGGGGLLTMTAPVVDIENFVGDYFYDCRFHDAELDLYVPLFGGVITFVERITRFTPD